MKVKAVSCPSCGASWGVDKDKTQVFCPYCGTKIVLQNEDGNKSKRTKKIVLAICAMIVLATITVGVWLFVDISGRKASDEASVSEVETLSVAINTYIQNEICPGENLPLMFEYQNAILEKITYEIHSVDMEKGTMEVEFTYIDVLALADSITDLNIKEDDYYAACLEKISSRDYKTITERVGVGYESSGEGYTLIQSEDLTNVISGGMLDFYLGALEEMGHE
ncbi:MAG: zinc ribbon domain-containing protein [Clostridia bacterium]|nr:zinc ribbon domain-containing protein [Clostridia bacterium]